jgi:hypothetical protein
VSGLPASNTASPTQQQHARSVACLPEHALVDIIAHPDLLGTWHNVCVCQPFQATIFQRQLDVFEKHQLVMLAVVWSPLALYGA